MRFAKKEDLDELAKLALPLFKVLKEKHDPHTFITIDCTGAHINQGWAGVPNPLWEVEE